MSEHLGDGWTGRQLLIPQRLRQRRVDLGLTQKQVVNRLARAGVHTTNRALSSLEHGAGVDAAKLPDLAAALDCTVTYLVGLTADPRRWDPDISAARADDGAGRRRAIVRDGSAPDWVERAPARRNGRAPSLIIGAGVPDRSLRGWRQRGDDD